MLSPACAMVGYALRLIGSAAVDRITCWHVCSSGGVRAAQQSGQTCSCVCVSKIRCVCVCALWKLVILTLLSSHGTFTPLWNGWSSSQELMIGGVRKFAQAARVISHASVSISWDLLAVCCVLCGRCGCCRLCIVCAQATSSQWGVAAVHLATIAADRIPFLRTHCSVSYAPAS